MAGYLPSLISPSLYLIISPKHLGYGIASGISNVVAGAVGAVGVVVLAPVVGTAVGAKQAGIVGGTVGLLGGMRINDGDHHYVRQCFLSILNILAVCSSL